MYDQATVRPAGTEVRIPPIISKVHEIKSLASQIREELLGLDDRLAPVLRNIPTNANGQSDKTSSAECALDGEIQELGQSLVGSLDLIRVLKSRITI